MSFTIDPTVLTQALRSIGQEYAAYVKRTGGEPHTVICEAMTKKVLDTAAWECYGGQRLDAKSGSLPIDSLARLLSKLWGVPVQVRTGTRPEYTFEVR